MAGLMGRPDPREESRSAPTNNLLVTVLIAFVPEIAIFLPNLLMGRGK